MKIKVIFSKFLDPLNSKDLSIRDIYDLHL